MKTKLTTLIIAAFVAVSAQGGSVWDAIGDFFKNNPTNTFDVSAYGLVNVADSVPTLKDGIGGGGRVGYWLTPAIGAALDLSYCDHSWTFASLSLAGRGTINVGQLGTLSTYLMAGPGWNIETSLEQDVVAVAGGGASLTFKKWPTVALFGEYQQVFTDREQQRVAFGVTKRF